METEVRLRSRVTTADGAAFSPRDVRAEGSSSGYTRAESVYPALLKESERFIGVDRWTIEAASLVSPTPRPAHRCIGRAASRKELRALVVVSDS